MLKNIFCLITVLLLCCSCVSRTTIKEPGLKGDNAAGKVNSEKKLVWFWDKDF
ncbi:MAG: hypothetical protein WC334_11535 [Kiritimatiellales bacterium]|jgi:uncharacterized protein YceK